jgi:hypothetical protein
VLSKYALRHRADVLIVGVLYSVIIS